jgi:hypothetical protein
MTADLNTQFDELVDCVDRLKLEVVVTLWRHAARCAYETGNLEQLAKLFHAGAPLPRQAGQLLALVLGSGKLTQKRRGGKRKMFASAATRYALTERTVRRLMSGDKLIGELSADEVRKLGLKMDDESARAWNANGHELSKLRDAKGHMSRKDAIELIAPNYGLEIDKLSDWMDRKTGASRRHKARAAHE